MRWTPTPCYFFFWGYDTLVFRNLDIFNLCMSWIFVYEDDCSQEKVSRRKKVSRPIHSCLTLEAYIFLSSLASQVIATFASNLPLISNYSNKMTSRSPSRGRQASKSPYSEVSRRVSRSPSRPRRSISPRSRSPTPRNSRYKSDSRSPSRERSPSPLRSTKVWKSSTAQLSPNLTYFLGCCREALQECQCRSPQGDIWHLWSNSRSGHASE